MRNKRKASVCDCGAMAFVKCTRGATAIFDPELVEKVGAWNWTTARTWHVARRLPKSKGGASIFMHHEVFGREDGMEVDHINGNPLDNRTSNLRFVTKAQNQMNRKSVVSSSGYKGVTRNKKSWSATIRKSVSGKKVTHYLGTFPTKEEAAAAYDRAAKFLFGEYASTNFGAAS